MVHDLERTSEDEEVRSEPYHKQIIFYLYHALSPVFTLNNET
jgi:hypothetical protein